MSWEHGLIKIMDFPTWFWNLNSTKQNAFLDKIENLLGYYNYTLVAYPDEQKVHVYDETI